MRVRIAIGTIGEDSEGGLGSSKVAFGEDIERPFTSRIGAGTADDLGTSSDGLGGSDDDSTGCVWLRVGVARVLYPGLLASSGDVGAPLVRRARRSLMLGFEA